MSKDALRKIDLLIGDLTEDETIAIAFKLWDNLTESQQDEFLAKIVRED